MHLFGFALNSSSLPRKKRKKSYNFKPLWCFLPNVLIFFLVLILFKIVLFKVIACQLFPVTPGQFFYCQMVVMMQNRTLECCSKCIWRILLVKHFVHFFLTWSYKETPLRHICQLWSHYIFLKDYNLGLSLILCHLFFKVFIAVTGNKSHLKFLWSNISQFMH